MHLNLGDEGATFATRPRAQAIVARLEQPTGERSLALNLDGVMAASPGFLDEFFGLLAEKYDTVDLSGGRTDLYPLIGRVIARRGLESRFRLTAEA